MQGINISSIFIFRPRNVIFQCLSISHAIEATFTETRIGSIKEGHGAKSYSDPNSWTIARVRELWAKHSRKLFPRPSTRTIDLSRKTRNVPSARDSSIERGCL